MEQFKLVACIVVFVLLAVYIDNIVGFTADDVGGEGGGYFNGAELNLDDLVALQKMFATPAKRGFCRSGFSYSAVLRRCIPSLAFLKGRGRRY